MARLIPSLRGSQKGDEMPSIDNIQRSRLKVTLIVCGVLLLLSSFPMWFIHYAALRGDFHVNAAWSAWGVGITAIGTLAGYYVNKESNRPSFVNNTVSNIHIPEARVLEGEDESDPQTMPI